MERVAYRLSGLNGSHVHTNFLQRPRWRISFLLMALLVAGAAQAGSDNCDGVLTDGQKEQRQFCDTHMGCSMVTSIMDSCISIKSFLKALSSDSNGPTKVNDGMVSEALEEIGVPKPGIASCTLSFDRSQCRQFLGIEQAPIPTAPIKYTPTPIQEIANEARELRSQYERAKLPGDEYRTATNAIAFCAQAVRHDSRYEQICSDAQRKVDECIAYREAWHVRRKAFMERASTTNLVDASQTIAKLDMPYCPTTLSEVDPVTPAQAAARRKAELDAPPRFAVAPQAKEIDINGQWVVSTTGEQWDFSMAATKIMVRIPDGSMLEYEWASQGVYRATNESNCVITVRSVSLMDLACKNAYTLIPLAEFQKRKQGRVDLTGTWAISGKNQDRVDITMNDIGFTYDHRKYFSNGFSNNYVQFSPNTYKNSSCTFTVTSKNLMTAACTNGNWQYTRLTPQQIAEANNKPQAVTQSTAQTVSSRYTGRGLSPAVCQAQLNPVADRMNRTTASAGGNTVLLLRAIIATVDESVAISRQCLPNSEVQRFIDQQLVKRANSLVTCRQISSADNCEVSPF